MLGAFPIMFNAIWAILSINIPLSPDINFNLWQYGTFAGITAIVLKNLFPPTGGGRE